MDVTFLVFLFLVSVHTNPWSGCGCGCSYALAAENVRGDDEQRFPAPPRSRDVAERTQRHLNRVKRFWGERLWANRGAALRLFVSSTGDDTNDGRASISSSPPRGPFRTLLRARDEIRALRRSQKGQNLPYPVLVFVQKGVYELEETFNLTSEDGGDSACAIVYAGYPGDEETPVLSGGVRITGWESVGEDGYVWQASVPSRVQAEVKQLFVNGERRIPCRSPNIDLHAREGPTTVYHRIRAPLPPPNERRGFYFSHETVSAEVMTASGTVVIVVQGGMVTQHTVTTTGQDDYGTFVILEQEVPVPIGYAADARFAVEGPVDLCDAPGEFFVDVQKRKIRYIPRAGEKITDVDVVLPRLSCLVDMQGAAHVHFFNLALQHTTTDEGRDGAVMIHGAHNVTLHGLALCHMGGFGVVISSDSHHVSMRHTAVWDAGGGAVYVGPALQVSMKRRIPRDIRITDCFLWDLGHVFPGIPGILLYAGERVLIAHNEVAFTGSSAISFGGIPGGPFPDRMAPDTRVEGNNLHHIGMGVLNELGGVHCRGSASESIVMHNVIRDVRPYSYGGWGLYADTGSSNTSWRSNFVFHSSCAGFHLVCGNNVKVHNNLLAYTGEWDGCVRHSPSPHCPSSMEFSQNIIWVNGSTPAVSLIPFVPTALLTVCFDWNVYAHVSATEPLVFPGGLNWNEWRRDKNQDDHSIMGDPGLGMSDLDFSPQPLSAASDVGFEAILLSSVGPRHVSPENSPPFL